MPSPFQVLLAHTEHLACLWPPLRVYFSLLGICNSLALPRAAEGPCSLPTTKEPRYANAPALPAEVAGKVMREGKKIPVAETYYLLTCQPRRWLK
jgi:hypothetical protein